jgi:hypothetical protein
MVATYFHGGLNSPCAKILQSKIHGIITHGRIDYGYASTWQHAGQEISSMNWRGQTPFSGKM